MSNILYLLITTPKLVLTGPVPVKIFKETASNLFFSQKNSSQEKLIT